MPVTTGDHRQTVQPCQIDCRPVLPPGAVGVQLQRMHAGAVPPEQPSQREAMHLRSHRAFVPERMIKYNERLPVAAYFVQQVAQQFFGPVRGVSTHRLHECQGESRRQIVDAEVKRCTAVRDRPFQRHGGVPAFLARAEQGRGFNAVVIGDGYQGAQMEAVLDLRRFELPGCLGRQRRCPPGTRDFRKGNVRKPTTPRLAAHEPSERGKG